MQHCGEGRAQTSAASRGLKHLSVQGQDRHWEDTCCAAALAAAEAAAAVESTVSVVLVSSQYAAAGARRSELLLSPLPSKLPTAVVEATARAPWAAVGVVAAVGAAPAAMAANSCCSLEVERVLMVAGSRVGL